MNPKVDEFLKSADQWRQEMEQLRTICLDSGLAEAFKWKKPCYTFRDSNVVIIQPFKDSCALMFFKGALLKDTRGVLEKPGRHSRVARRISFTSVAEIDEAEPILKSYIREAIQAEKKGLEVEMEEQSTPVPEEFQTKLDENPALKSAFESLTAGRQRGYLLYFGKAKQSKTRKRRVEKCLERIMDGKGLRD